MKCIYQRSVFMNNERYIIDVTRMEDIYIYIYLRYTLEYVIIMNSGDKF